MLRYRQNKYFLPLFALVLAMYPLAAFSIPYVPLEQAEQEAEMRHQTLPQSGPLSLPLSELDEFEYALEYQQVITWLPTLQVDWPGDDFGGMMEGEEDLDIIQTDNTQEALRDWARYGIRTGDLELFEENIDAAWEYILLHPAYDEEGGGNPNYYRVHNCGWGLVATMEYTRAYGDSTYMWYGDSCAAYIDTWRLPWSGQGIELNPLAAGYGAGTLYLYGVWRDNPDWIEAAQEIANDVKTWIENNPNRLNVNETWAMSGGTAMWGVVTALFLEDPVAGEEWLPNYTQHLDIYSGPGQWNNSWTVWYGHAWNAIHQVIGDEESFENVLAVADFLLEQDEIDDDGGIPATENQYENDQSWTSAYLIWYVLEYILDVAGYDYDVAASEIISPNPMFPVGIGLPVEIRSLVANTGLNDIEDVTVTVTVDDFESSTTISLERGADGVVEFDDMWTPDPNLGETRIMTITVEHELDANPENNVYVDTFTVLPTADVSFQILDGNTLEGIESAITLYYQDGEYPYPFYEINTGTDGIAFLQNAIVGNYEVRVDPDVIPYLRTYDWLEVVEGQDNEAEIFLFPARVLFVSENHFGFNDEFIMEALDELLWLGVTYYYFETTGGDDPTDYLDMVESVLWATGNGTDPVLQQSYQSELAEFLDNGNSMILAGQNILNQWEDNNFLNDYFGVDAGELDFADQYLQPVPDAYEINEGDSLLVVGAGGAGGQTEMDEIISVNGSVPVYQYAVSDRIGVVTKTGDGDNPYHTAFCGFDIEGINSETGNVFLTRAEFLTQLYTAFGIFETAINEDITEKLPQAFAIKSWPNPFNPTLNVSIQSPAKGSLNIGIYDILGRQVSGLRESNWNGGQYNFTWDGSNFASGTYILQVEHGKQSLVRRVTLLK